MTVFVCLLGFGWFVGGLFSRWCLPLCFGTEGMKAPPCSLKLLLLFSVLSSFLSPICASLDFYWFSYSSPPPVPASFSLNSRCLSSLWRAGSVGGDWYGKAVQVPLLSCLPLFLLEMITLMTSQQNFPPKSLCSLAFALLTLVLSALSSTWCWTVTGSIGTLVCHFCNRHSW